MFYRLGQWSHDRRRWVLAAWVAFLLLIGGISGAAGSAFRDSFNLPDSESRRGFDILDEEFGGQGTGASGTIVFRAEQGVEDPSVRGPLEELFAEVEEIPEVTHVVSPYSEEGAEQISSREQEAGLIAYATVELPEDIDFTRAGEIRDEIIAATPEVDGLQVEMGGYIFAEFEEPSSEILGLAFAIIILIIAFGSVLAMGLPVSVALFGIGIGTSILTVASHVLTVPETSTFLGIMIGLGVGIDYALLIVTRYREQLHAGHSVRESIAIAHDTAGRSVLFAGSTVVISLMGMVLVGVTFVNGLALGAALVVAITVAASLTLLPALLGFAGERVELTRWRGLLAAGSIALGLAGVGLAVGPLAGLGFLAAVGLLVAGSFVAPLRGEVRWLRAKPRRETAAYRWSRVIQHHPWITAALGAAVLIGLSIPVFGLRLGTSDESNYPEGTTTKEAYDLLVAGFGPGFNGPLLLAAQLPEGADQAAIDAVQPVLRQTDGVAFASPAQPNDPDDPTAVIWQVVPETGPQESETTKLVHRLRDDVLPPLEEPLGTEVAVTGSVAVNIDFTSYLESRMPYFFGAVLTLSFLLLMTVFRSLLVPIKAVIMNGLSIGAAYGIVVALFQWGWLSDITGVQPAPIEPWIPMMLFAIVFGLSMDYEVFLLSRIREEWVRTGDSRESVADGLAATAKVITAAAAIMVFVFGSFMLEDDRVLKLMGTGLAAAIFFDATVVRMLLVPATMELLGDKNWWLPRWLDRVLPNLDVEGHAPPPDEEDPGDGTGEPEEVREPVPV